MKTCKVPLLVVFFALVLCVQAAPDLTQTISELRLTDGRVLRDVQLKAYNGKGVMVRHAEGVAQINYALFPDEYREAVLAKKPAPSTTAASPRTPPAMAEPAKRAPAAPQQIKVEVHAVSGSIQIASGRQAHALANAEVGAYPLELFGNLDQARRQHMMPAHIATRRLMRGQGDGDRIDAKSVEEFYRTEYESWDDLPQTPFKARTDADGSFVLPVPVQGQWVVLARGQMTDEYATRYFIWAMPINSDNIVLTRGNQYPMLKDD